MLYVVIPAWMWAILLLAGWIILTNHAYNQLTFRHPVMLGLLGIMALQAIAASSSAIATSQYSIGRFACMMGIFGALASMLFTLAEAATLVYLSRVWPRHSNGNRRQFAPWVILWLIFKLIALLAHMRSAALCTV